MSMVYFFIDNYKKLSYTEKNKIGTVIFLCFETKGEYYHQN